MSPSTIRRAAIIGVGAATLVCASSAGAANVARFKVDVHARVATTWTRNFSEPGCQDGTTETENGNGTQTLTFSATHRPVKFTFFGPGQAQFRTSPTILRGRYVANRKGSMVTNDPGCGGQQIQSTAGCTTYKGRASVQWMWPATPYKKLYLDAGPAPTHDNVDCPFVFTEGPLITFDVPGPNDGAPFVRTTPVKLSHFLFHTRRRKLTWHAHGTWHPQVEAGDSATNVMDWTVTLHRVH